MANSLQELLAKAQNLMQNGRPKEARKVCASLVKQHPTVPQAWLLAGHAAAQSGDFPAAIEHYARLVALAPQAAEAHFHLANAQRAAGRDDAAVTSYRRSAELAPGAHGPLVNLSGLLLQMGDAAAALPVARGAVRATPKLAAAWCNLAGALIECGETEEAIEAARRALMLDPHNVEAHFTLGKSLLPSQPEEAAAAFQRAIELKPDLKGVHYLLAGVLKAQGKRLEAVAAYRAAIAVDPAFAVAQNDLANTLKDLGRYDEAVVAYRAAIDADPTYAGAVNNMGVTLQEQGKLAEAAAAFQRALEITPDYTEAFRNLANSKRFHRQDDLTRRMQALAERPDIGGEAKIHLHFALGKVHGDLGDTEASFRHFEAGNKLKRATFTYDRKGVEGYFKDLETCFDVDLFQRHLKNGNQDATPLFVVGLPRSGTTLVEQILASHPDVFGAGELSLLGNVIFGTSHPSAFDDFPKNLAKAADADLSQAGQGYLENLRSLSQSHRHIVDKMPANFQFVGLIKLILPKARIVHCVRNPIDTCFSIYRNYFFEHQPHAYDLEDLAAFHNLYSDLMAHWHRVLPGFVFDISYESLVETQEEETRRLLDFCNLSWDPACLEFHKLDKAVKTASAYQVRRPLYKTSVAAWKNYETYLGPLISKLKT